jgi:hypothetical protein
MCESSEGTKPDGAGPYDTQWMERLAHYAFMYVPGPRWSMKEAAGKTKQAHLDGGLALALVDLIERNPETWKEMWEALSGEPT